MMLKFFGAILLVASTTLMGFWYSNAVQNRQRFLKEFTVFMNTLKTYIRYSGGDVCELIISSSATSDQLHILKAEFENPQNPDYVAKQKAFIKAIPKSSGLKKEDTALLQEFFAGLGTTDLDGETSHIDMYAVLFAKNLHDAEDSCTKKAKLYKMLGFFSGAAAALVIV